MLVADAEIFHIMVGMLPLDYTDLQRREYLATTESQITTLGAFLVMICAAAPFYAAGKFLFCD